MTMDTKRLDYLLQQYAKQLLTDAEKLELLELLEAPGDLVEEQLAYMIASQEGEHQPLPLAVLQPLIDRVVEVDRPIAGNKAPHVHRISSWWWMAASILVLIVSGGIVNHLLKHNRYQGKSINQPYPQILAGGNKAVLTLGDGSVVRLDSTGNQMIRQGNTNIHLQGGQLQYESEGEAPNVAYNTLTTPRGGQFQLRLPDGTKVWLNAASSLHFPTTFNGSERKVEVTGEAYFEVAKDEKHPFKVMVQGNTAIEVLGTSFNVHAYTDENKVSTALLEGSVLISRGKEKTLLKQGQEALLQPDNDAITVVSGIDADKVLAWKNGFFNFDGAGLKEVMQQISRWYDIEIVYEKGVPDVEFVGLMDRNVSLPVLLKWLQEFDIHFRVEEGRRLVVTP